MGSVGSAVTKKSILYNGIHIEGTPANQKKADEVVSGVRDVLKDFGFDSELRNIYFSEKGTLTRGEASASMNGLGDLNISNKYLSTYIKNSNGYFVSDTYYGTGTHEAGHAVVNALLKNNVDINIDDTNKSSGRIHLERAVARRKGKLEHYILKEASKRYGSNVKISGYGSTKEIEKVAEAVSDVYTNGSKANPYSKTIVRVMKDIKSGKLRPKLKVSKREMGV